MDKPHPQRQEARASGGPGAVEPGQRQMVLTDPALDQRFEEAVTLYKAGQVGQAEAQLRALLGQAAYLPAMVILAHILIQKQALDEAQELLAIAEEAAPDDPLVLLVLGQLWLQRRDLQRARSYLGRIDPSDLPLAIQVGLQGLSHWCCILDRVLEVVGRPGNAQLLGAMEDEPTLASALHRLPAPWLEAADTAHGVSAVGPRRGRELRQPLAAATPSNAGATSGPDRVSTWVFKVSLGRSVWRELELREDQTLHDLHLGIQVAFAWDGDHLYSFFMSNKAWDRWTEYAHPQVDDAPPADEVTLAELGLVPGQKFLYIYDYGDEIRHRITVLERREVEPGARYPRILREKGAAPRRWD